MLKATSSLYALVISVVIAIICGALILFDQLMIRQYTLLESKTTVMEQANNAFYKLQAALTISTEDQEFNFPEFQQPRLLITGKKKKWGAFQILAVKATNNHHSCQKIAIVGANWAALDDLVLFVRNQDMPIYMGGINNFTGNIALPKPGISKDYSANSNGEFQLDPSTFNQLTSTDTLPATFSHLHQYLDKLCLGQFNATDSIILLERSIPTLPSRSFNQSTTVLFSKDSILLNDLSLDGNIIVFSAAHISVSSTTSLNNILLVSPSIELAENFTGSCQLISENHIVLNRNVKLNYPSAIIHFDRGDSLQLGETVRIDSGSQIIGSLLMLTATKNAQRSTLLANNAVNITGIVFCETRIDFQGTCLGKAYINKFVSTRGSYSENTASNLSFLRDNRTPFFAGPFFDQAGSFSIISQWIIK